MNAAPLTLDVLASDRHFDRQLVLVREHWASVRHLWIEDPGPAASKLRADLPPDFMLGCGMPGIGRIGPTRDGRFEFAEDGKAAVIVPCYAGLPDLLGANAERHVEYLLDLVAVDLANPDRFRLRRGEALVLGNAFLEIAGQIGAPVSVLRNPLTWLLAGGAGVVVLDWDWAPDILLGHELIAEDLDLGQRLDAALRPSISIGRAAA